jgi:hypothetical protein
MNIEERKDMLKRIKEERISNMIIPGSKVLVRAFVLKEENIGFQLQEKKENTKYQNRGVVLAVGNNLSKDIADIEVGDIVDFKPEGFLGLAILDKEVGKPATIDDIDPIFLIDDFMIEWYNKVENNEEII